MLFEVCVRTFLELLHWKCTLNMEKFGEIICFKKSNGKSFDELLV